MQSRFIRGDCLDVLRDVPFSSVDLIVTSPPYPGKRRQERENYVHWFALRAAEFKRVLKPQGSFVLNVKEGCYDGERETWAIELILALKQQKWMWVEEYIWHKKTTAPGKWPNRFRDLWERCLHFSKQKKIAMYQDAVKVPIGDWAVSRLNNLSKKDCIRDPSATGSGFGKNVSNWVGRDLVYPGNVLHISSETGNKNHHSAFPEALPEWFIKLFTKPRDTVLDPFVGSGTTCVVADSLDRRWIGIDSDPEAIATARMRMGERSTRRVA